MMASWTKTNICREKQLGQPVAWFSNSFPAIICYRQIMEGRKGLDKKFKSYSSHKWVLKVWLRITCIRFRNLLIKNTEFPWTCESYQILVSGYRTCNWAWTPKHLEQAFWNCTESKTNSETLRREALYHSVRFFLSWHSDRAIYWLCDFIQIVPSFTFFGMKNTHIDNYS